MSEIETCSHCGAKMVEYKHSFNQGMASSLWKLWNSGGDKNLQELGLNHNQYTNFYKLKYWNLAVQIHEGGRWQITERGRDFLFGKEDIHQRVVSYRGVVVDSIGDLINISDKLETSYLQHEDYIRECQNVSEPQRELF